MAEVSSSRWRTGRWLAVAVVSTVMALLVRQSVGADLAHRFPFMPFYAAVATSAWAGGRVAGGLTTAFAAALDWWLAPPGGHDWLHGVGAIGFIVVGLLTSLLIGHLRRLVERERTAGEGERRFRALVDKSADVIVTCDNEERFLFASPSVRAVTGYTVEEFLRLTQAEFLHPADLATWRAALARVKGAPGATATVQSRYRHRDGRVRWLEGTCTNLLSDPAVGAVVATLRDVTARKRAEADTVLMAEFTAEVSEHRDENALITATCRRLADHLGISCCAVIDVSSHPVPRTTMWGTWPGGTTDVVAEALGTLLQAAALKATGERVLVVSDSGADLGLTAADREAAGKAGLGAFVVVPLRAHGDTGSSLIVGDGRAREWSAEDVRIIEHLSTRAWYAVQQSRLLRQHLEARRAAESANALKDEFVAVVSHELRSPLNAILGWAQVASVDPSQRDRALDTIVRNARRQARLVDDLLDLARTIAGQEPLTPVPVDLAHVVRATVESVTPVAREKGVLGDAARLQQVAWNLVSNAVKFTPAGGSVAIELHASDRDATLTVTDTGEGIDPAFLPHVFDRFRQAQGPATRRRGGLGLGLSIARHFVEAHQGRVTAHSDGPGRGARFTVVLPLAASVPEESSAE